MNSLPPKPKVLINLATGVVGGGVQVGRSLAEHVLTGGWPEIDARIALPRAVAAQMGRLILDDRVVVLNESPAALIRGHGARRALTQLERRFRPDLIYSAAFPSYVRFSSPEVGRYTNPWEIMDNLPWHVYPRRERFRIALGAQYRLLWARRAVHFETQTAAAKAGIAKRLRVPPDRVSVVPNSANPIFRRQPEPPNSECEKRVFCLAAAYPHKNLKVIPAVAARMKSTHGIGNVRFVLTLPGNSQVAREVLDLSVDLGVQDMITNLGMLSLSQCLTEYQRSLCVFVPSLLEVFSATYLEAMAVGRALVVADRPFARDVCGDAAYYANPEDPGSMASALADVCSREPFRQTLVELGRNRLEQFPAPEDRWKMVSAMLEDTLLQHRRGR